MMVSSVKRFGHPSDLYCEIRIAANSDSYSFLLNLLRDLYFFVKQDVRTMKNVPNFERFLGISIHSIWIALQLTIK